MFSSFFLFLVFMIMLIVGMEFLDHEEPLMILAGFILGFIGSIGVVMSIVSVVRLIIGGG